MIKFLSILAFFTVLFTQAQEFNDHYIHYSRTGFDEDCGAAVMDFNNDGYTDILLGLEARGEFLCLENNSFHFFQMKRIFDTLGGYNYIQSIDYETDGDMDIIFSGRYSGTATRLYLLKNTGGNQFENILIGECGTIEHLEMLDLDGDSDQDIFYSEKEVSNSLYIFENIGTDNFTPEAISLPGQNTHFYGTGDFNNDNLPDPVGSYYSPEGFVSGILENTGNLAFNFLPLDTTSNYVRRSVIGDFSNDGFPDLLILPAETEIMASYHVNTGNFTFTQSSIDFGGSYIPGPLVDYDTDGDLDFFAYGPSLKVQLFTNSGNTFSPQILIQQTLCHPIAYTDMDNDGLKDLVLHARGRVEIHKQLPNGNYTLFYDNWAQVAGTNITVTDWDGNGMNDIISTNYREVNFYMQHYNELIRHPVSFSLTGPQIYGSSNVVQSLLYDRDNDGDLDLLCFVNISLVWLINDNGSFLQETILDVAGASQVLWVGDLDNDNKHDIIYYDWDEPFIRLEQEGNSYTTSTLPEIISAYFFDIADLDNDDDKDLIKITRYVSEERNELHLWKNNGGNFTYTMIEDLSSFFPFDLTQGVNRVSFRLIDIDSDTDLDLFILSQNHNKLVLFRNDGAGNFSGTEIAVTLNGPRALDFADFNSDGNLDLSLSNSGDGKMLVLLNDGNENFTINPVSQHAGYPDEHVARDFDRDGDIDLVTGSLYDKKIMFLENTSISCQNSYMYLNDTICSSDSLFFASDFISEAGFHFDTLSNNVGCDSVIVFELFKHYDINLSITEMNDELTASSGFVSYQWYLDGTPLPGENSDSLNASEYEPGYYKVEVLSENGCSKMSDSILVEFGISTLQDQHFDREFRLYPNPAQDELNVYSTSGKISGLNLYTPDRKELEKIRFITAQTSVKLRVDKLKPGIYFLEIESEGQLFFKKVQVL